MSEAMLLLFVSSRSRIRLLLWVGSVITFKRTRKQINVKVADQIVKLQEERGLMKKLVVLSRTKLELDVAELFTKHEFSVVPK